MAIDLGGLGAIGSGAAGGVPAARVAWARAQQAQREQEAARLLGSLGPDAFQGADLSWLPGATPATPSQQTPPPPAPGPQIATGPNVATAPPPASTAAPGGSLATTPLATAQAPAAGATPPVQQGAGPMQGPGGPGPMNGRFSLGQLVATLKSNNPQADPGAIWEAVKQYNSVLLPADRALYSLLLGQQRIGVQQGNLDARNRQIDVGHQDRLAALAERQNIADEVDRRVRERVAAGDPTAKALKPQFDYLNSQRRALTGQYARASGDDAKQAELASQIDAIDAKIETLRGKLAAGRPGADVSGAGSAAGPAGAPDPSTLQEGQTGTDGNGQRWTVKSGKWVKG